MLWRKNRAGRGVGREYLHWTGWSKGTSLGGSVCLEKGRENQEMKLGIGGQSSGGHSKNLGFYSVLDGNLFHWF